MYVGQKPETTGDVDSYIKSRWRQVYSVITYKKSLFFKTSDESDFLFLRYALYVQLFYVLFFFVVIHAPFHFLSSSFGACWVAPVAQKHLEYKC